MKKIYNEKKYIILFKFSISLINKRKFFNELNSLVAIVVVISLVIKITELLKSLFP